MTTQSGRTYEVKENAMSKPEYANGKEDASAKGSPNVTNLVALPGENCHG